MRNEKTCESFRQTNTKAVYKYVKLTANTDECVTPLQAFSKFNFAKTIMIKYYRGDTLSKSPIYHNEQHTHFLYSRHPNRRLNPRFKTKRAAIPRFEYEWQVDTLSESGGQIFFCPEKFAVPFARKIYIPYFFRLGVLRYEFDIFFMPTFLRGRSTASYAPVANIIARFVLPIFSSACLTP